LCETPNNTASLVAFQGTVDVELVLEDPFAGNDICSVRTINQIPSVVELQGVELLMAAHQLGSARAARYVFGIGDKVAVV
jgi:ABC-type lipopolysaccharide export system ATPase subunit